MADNDQAYKDDVAPAGSPFRPLYDGRIMFSGQPIALVVAQTSEIARFAASLVRVDYETDTHITDVHCQREAAIPLKPPGDPIEAMFTPVSYTHLDVYKRQSQDGIETTRERMPSASSSSCA